MKEHTCDNCGQKYSSTRTLSNHRKNSKHCAPFQHAYFTCMRCGKGYENMKQFSLHSAHCRGTKNSYRIPDETRWQTRCAVLEGIIEATLGISVPSIDYNDNFVTVGSLKRLKETVKSRISGDDRSISPIHVETTPDTARVCEENLPILESPTVKNTGKIEKKSPCKCTEQKSANNKSESAIPMKEDSTLEMKEKEENPPVPTRTESVIVIPDHTPLEWSEYTQTKTPTDFLARYAITNEPREATTEEYREYRETYLSAAISIIKQRSDETAVIYVLTRIREKLVGSMGNYKSPAVFDTCRVYRGILKALTAEGWNADNAKECMEKYMLPYPLIRLTDIHLDYPEIRPTNYDDELCKEVLTHYYTGKFGPGFAGNGGGMIFRIFRFNAAINTFIFSPQPWWERDCYYAPQRGERHQQNPITFITRSRGKWEYDYFLQRYSEELYGEIAEAIRVQFRDLYQLIHGTNEYIDDWDQNLGIYTEDLHNLLRCYFSFYSEFSLNEFTERMRLQVAEDTMTASKKIIDASEFSVGRPPDKKIAKKIWDSLKTPPIYDRVFVGFMALFDIPETRKFWDSATGLRGDGYWYFNDSAYEKFLQPRFHRLFRCLCSDTFFSVTGDFEQNHSSVGCDASILSGFPQIPYLQTPTTSQT